MSGIATRAKVAFVPLALIVIAALAMLLAGANPIVAFAALLRGGLGGPHQIGETLVQTTALLFPALAVALALRAGLFNIGAEGQLVIGGLAAGALGAAYVGPGYLAIPLVLGAGALGGGAWGALAGLIKARFGGSEVIATLMLNVIAGLLANYLAVGIFAAPGGEGAETASLPPAAWLPVLLPGTRLSVAILLALALAVVMRVGLARTVFGYALRATGSAPEAAARAGIDVHRIAFVTLTLSGAIAGLGGATIVAGVLHRFNTALSPGYGFIAIAVALVGALDPLKICVAAFAFGLLQSGSLAMQSLAHVPKDLVTIVEGLAIVALAARRYAA